MRTPTFGSAKALLAATYETIAGAASKYVPLIGPSSTTALTVNTYLVSQATLYARGHKVIDDGNSSLTIESSVNDGASAVAVISRATNALTTAGAKIHQFLNAAVEKAFIDKDGQFENTVAGMGMVLKSPDGTRYRVTVANGGAVTSTAL